MTPTILLADVHVMISKGLRKLLELDFGYRDVESVTSCNAVLRTLKKRTFTHLVMDIGLSDGSVLEILPVIKDLYPDTRVMVYSAKPPGIYERGLQRFGVYHYLSKEADEQETIRRFRHFLSELETVKAKEQHGLESPFACLTGRQLEVMHYLLQGKTGNEIAEALNVKSNTVSTIKSQLLERTGTRNMIELTALANLYSLT
jgi:two-component system, NarL family, invasion response regulator UvrY